jgi:hypothetical protein
VGEFLINTPTKTNQPTNPLAQNTIGWSHKTRTKTNELTDQSQTNHFDVGGAWRLCATVRAVYPVNKLDQTALPLHCYSITNMSAGGLLPAAPCRQTAYSERSNFGKQDQSAPALRRQTICKTPATSLLKPFAQRHAPAGSLGGAPAATSAVEEGSRDDCLGRRGAAAAEAAGAAGARTGRSRSSAPRAGCGL